MATSRASVVIPSYNTAKTIRTTLEHLLRQTADARLIEVIVVDSSDDTSTKSLLEAMTRLDSRVRVITSGVRVMPAKQRNIGAEQARGDVLAFIDADAYPAPNWLEGLLAAHDAGWLVGGGSYRVPEFQRGNQVAVAQYYLEFNEYIDVGLPRAKRMLPTCNLFCDAALFAELGGIPEIRASEDTLFGLKANKRHPVMFLPDAPVYHIFREDMSHYLSNQQLLGKYVYVYRRHVYASPYLRPQMVQFALPLYLGAKLARIVPRIVAAGPEHWLPFARSAPNFMRGLWNWGKGFRDGSRDFETLRQGLNESDT